jgi:hypothetical protein
LFKNILKIKIGVFQNFKNLLDGSQSLENVLARVARKEYFSRFFKFQKILHSRGTVLME